MNEVFNIATSALVAQRTRMNVIAGNIANKEVTRNVDGESVPFRRRVALMATGNPAAGARAAGVHVAQVVEDPGPFPKRWDPEHPDAVRAGPDEGYVRMSNVNYHTEMVNAMTAARAYEANVTVMEMAKSMASSTLRLLM